MFCSIPRTLISSGYSGASFHIFAHQTFLRARQGCVYCGSSGSKREISKVGSMNFAITVIHCISERPVTTFIHGQQVYANCFVRSRSFVLIFSPFPQLKCSPFSLSIPERAQRPKSRTLRQL